MHFNDITNDLTNVGKIFYMSGYENNNLRKRPATNTKPTKVSMELFSKLYPQHAQYFPEHVLPVKINKDGSITTEHLVIYTDVHHFFDNEKESIAWYNESIEKVLTLIDAFKEKTSTMKIKIK
ncbi:hypothetical protein XaC1_213 [Xanthomonas phage XaC1]|nr:hypothetical protein XaC1_213 [Xanthomonas phage XaC1]